MSNAIKTAVVAAINEGTLGLNIPSYLEAQVDAAVNAIAENLSVQADSIADQIRATADNFDGLSEADVENVLIQVGLADAPEPEVEEVPEVAAPEGDVTALTAAVTALAATVEKIVAAAQANGIRI